MATPDEILALRRLIAQLDDADPFTDEILSDRIDAAGGDIRLVAYDIWTEKAAAYAGLTDVQEGSSRRSLGDLYEQALAMVKWFAPPDGGVDLSMRPGRTRAIERP